MLEGHLIRSISCKCISLHLPYSARSIKSAGLYCLQGLILNFSAVMLIKIMMKEMIMVSVGGDCLIPRSGLNSTSDINSIQYT